MIFIAPRKLFIAPVVFICYNRNNDTLYKGKITNGKKRSDIRIFTEFEKSRIFIGKSSDDIFIEGYLGICKQSKIYKDNNYENIILELNKIIYYFDKTKDTNVKIIPYILFNKEFRYKIKVYMSNAIDDDFYLKTN